MTNNLRLPTHFKTLILIFFVCLLVHCVDTNIIIFETHNLPNNNWNCKDTVVFRTVPDDISSSFNCYIDIRNSGVYPYSNLYLFVITCYPDGKKSRDTIETILADTQGKWLGKGLGDIKETRLLLKKGLRFHQKGIYTFKVVQAMRLDCLKGIYSIGMKIEKNFE